MKKLICLFIILSLNTAHAEILFEDTVVIAPINGDRLGLGHEGIECGEVREPVFVDMEEAVISSKSIMNLTKIEPQLYFYKSESTNNHWLCNVINLVKKLSLKASFNSLPAKLKIESNSIQNNYSISLKVDTRSNLIPPLIFFANASDSQVKQIIDASQR